MDKALSLFTNTHIDNHAAKTLFLLHGTGGSKDDFLFLDSLLSKKYNLLGIGGNVDENGMRRFFKRTSIGVFDQENIRQESKKLNRFVSEWIDQHNIINDTVTFLGYSNGANMILASLFYYPNIIRNAILLHPMLPFIPEKNLDLSSHMFLLTYGKSDEMISAPETKKAIEILKNRGANPEIYEYPGGHEISPKEAKDVVQYLTTSAKTI